MIRYIGCLILLLFFNLGVLKSQTLVLNPIAATCEANGQIDVSLTGGDGTEEFVIISGPGCGPTTCPLDDAPDGMFMSLIPGTYEVAAIASDGTTITMESAEVIGMYMEPSFTARSIAGCEGQNNAIIYHGSVINGNDPFEWRVFPGTVMDYLLPIGPNEMVLPFVNQDTFPGINAQSNLYDEATGSEGSISNPNPGVWTMQVKDSCDVIRTREVFVEIIPLDFEWTFSRSCSIEDCEVVDLNSISVRYQDGSSMYLSENSTVYPNFSPIIVSQVMNNGSIHVLATITDDNINDQFPISFIREACVDTVELTLELGCGLTSPRTINFNCLPRIYSSTSCSTGRQNINFFNVAYHYYCKDNVELTIQSCTDQSIVYSGSVEEYSTSEMDSFLITLNNTCFDVESETKVYYEEPSSGLPSLYFRPAPSCNGSNTFFTFRRNGADSLVLISAPTGYANSLPEDITSNTIYGPFGEYCFEIFTNCDVEAEQCFEFENYDLDFDINTIVTCQTAIAEITPLNINNYDFFNGYHTYASLEYFDITTNTWNLIYNLNTEIVSTFDLNNLSISCGAEIRVVWGVQDDFTNISTLCDSISLNELPCGNIPDGVNIVPYECQDLGTCTDAIYNIVVESPLVGGVAPYTFWLFNSGETIACCSPIQEVVTSDPVGQFTNICVEDLPLDIFITDDCGMQIMTEVSIGVADAGPITVALIQVCSSESTDLQAYADNGENGFFTPIDGAPDLDGTVFLPDESLAGQCLKYSYTIPDGTYPQQCGDIVDTVSVCSIDCNQAFCELYNPIIRTICDDKGTNDPRDDQHLYYVTVIGTFLSDGFSVSGDDNQTGLIYGIENGPFGPIDILGDDGALNLTFTDNGNSGCNTELNSFLTACTRSCFIDQPDVEAVCNDGGTPFDSSDDFLTITIDPYIYGIKNGQTVEIAANIDNSLFTPNSFTVDSGPIDITFDTSVTNTSPLFMTLSNGLSGPLPSPLGCSHSFEVINTGDCSVTCPSENCANISVIRRD